MEIAILQTNSRSTPGRLLEQLFQKQLVVRSITPWPASYRFPRWGSVTVITQGDQAPLRSVIPISAQPQILFRIPSHGAIYHTIALKQQWLLPAA